ncbi:MAG TPA: ABC transporter permease [Opitutales bacterium]|nr:ABC transporter permease [Opitutales bacterium]
MKALIESILRVSALIRKELVSIVKDRRTLGSLLFPPIIQCFVFGYAASFDLSNIPYAVYDSSRSEPSRELSAAFDGTGIFHRVATIHNQADITRLVDTGQVVLVISIAPDFERELEGGRPATIQMIADGRNSNTAATALSYANTIVAGFNAKRNAAAGIAQPASSVSPRIWYNPNLETRWSMVPALIATLTLLQTLLLASMSVAREREFGTFDQLLVTPLRPYEIMLGKMIPSTLIGFIQATNVLLVAQLWFHIPFEGTLLPLYIGLFIFLLAAVGMGLFVSSIAATMQQAMLYSFVLIMPFMLLSGLTTPVENMPPFIRALTYFNPLRHAIDITRRVYLDGAGLADILPEIRALAGIAAVTLTSSVWFFRRKLY